MKLSCVLSVVFLVASLTHANVVAEYLKTGLGPRNTLFRRQAVAYGSGADRDSETWSSYKRYREWGAIYWNKVFTQGKQGNPVDRELQDTYDRGIALTATTNVKDTAFLQSQHASAIGERIAKSIGTQYAKRGLLDEIVPFTSISPEPLSHPSRVSLITGKILRILPLGDSITDGFQSTDKNGYRWNLVKDLSKNNVTMIGSQRVGNMPNNENEGHNGATIDQIAKFATLSTPKQPNVILLHAGTNDMGIPRDPDTAPNRLGSLIDQLTAACPEAAILVAKIIPSSNTAIQARIAKYNNAVDGLVKTRADAGNHVMMVDMSATITTNDLYDSLHPNDRGYKKMADCWLSGIEHANKVGWITDPVTVSSNGNGRRNRSRQIGPKLLARHVKKLSIRSADMAGLRAGGNFRRKRSPHSNARPRQSGDLQNQNLRMPV